MRETPCILVVDDQPANRDIFQTRLTVSGYQVILAGDGEEALRVAREQLPDLVLLDVMMPKISGIDVCRELKGDPSLPYIPIIMVTAKADSKDVVVGLEAGAEEYLTKPVDQAALVARVKSMLRIKDLHDKVQEQAARLEAQSQELAGWNRTLEERVQKQLAELERAGRLKRFFSPQLAEALLSSGAEEFLQSHRQEITVVFCDLRGFTAFSETVAPEELMEVLRTYHGAMGTLISRFEGTLERFTGDGLMVFFNDPQPVPDHGERAVRMALAMRAEMEGLSEAWRKQGHQLDFGVGIARGYATLGMIGFEGRVDYGAIGPVTNLAARLCEQARGGQILVSQRVFADVEALVESRSAGNLELKGIHNPVTTYDVLGLKNGG
ncbi:MAG: response regulator [SAR324 cluster bacterium]|nr:response regulator [SAR324 cluster bacterium]